MITHSCCCKCNNCGWQGNDDQLYLVEFNLEDLEETPTATEDKYGNVIRYSKEPTDVDFLNGCPNCLTDQYLINL